MFLSSCTGLPQYSLLVPFFSFNIFYSSCCPQFFCQSPSGEVPFSFCHLLYVRSFLTANWRHPQIPVCVPLAFPVGSSGFRPLTLSSNILFKRVCAVIFNASLCCRTIPGLCRTLTIFTLRILRPVPGASAGSI